MSTDGARTVAVCADRSPAGLRALLWAAREARRRALPLRLVAPDAGEPRSARRSSLAEAMAAVRAAVPDLPVVGGGAPGGVARALCRLSADVAALVVPATLPEVEAVVAGSYCPVVAVPAGAASPPVETGPVVLGAAPWTGDDVIGFAVEEASDRGAALQAVRAWAERPVDLGWLRPDRFDAWDTAEGRARRELEHALSAWRIAHPEVPVQALVVRERADDLLVELSRHARLLVIGRSARGALLASLAASPVGALMRYASCPVAIVPSGGPPRATWLPSRSRAHALVGP